jgi:glutaminyl-tRNA synthetase
LQVVSDAQIEPALAEAAPGTRFQFERLGYFCVDTVDSKPGHPVFNRIVPLRDSWAKLAETAK